MSGQLSSPFLSTNELLAPMAAYDTHANQLLQQQKAQQDIGLKDMATVGQAGASLLGMPEDQAAAAYGPMRADLQARGFGKNLPAQYPGHAATAAFVQRSLSLPEQYTLGIITPPGTQAAIDAALGRGGTTTGSPGATTGGGGSTATTNGVPANAGALRDQLVSALGVSPEDAGAILSNFHAESGLNAGINEIHPVIPGSRGGYGLAQWTGQRRDALEAFAQQNKLDVSQPATQLAFMKQELQQPEYAGILKAMAAAKTPEEKATIFFHGYESGGAPSLEGQLPGHVSRARAYAGLPAAQGGAAPGAPPGPPAADGRYQVASNAPVPPPASTAPAGGDLVGPRVLPPIGPGSPVVTPQLLANTPAPQPQAQIPQPPANRAMPGGPDGPPAPTPPPAQQPPAPGVRAALPRAADVPTGTNSPQYQQAADLQRRALALEAQVDPTGRLKQLAAGLRQQAQLLLQTDSVVQTQEGQLHPLTGKVDETAKPLADYKETSPGSGIWVGGPGTDPKFQPPGRLVVTPGGDVYQTTSGGPRLLKSTDPAAVAALKEAEAAGTATGTAVAKQLPELMATARNAAAQEGQIDYAANQLREAAKGGVPSGYFSPALATAAAAAKSLGLDGALRAVGVNPEAVGNVQTAQKTLSVIGGAILRQALGPGSAITDGKIEAFIHTQPGIETDPQALQRIMAWARSQYTYERELGHAAASEAAKPENAGRLPPHWLPAYYRDHGFAPIYDPGTQEMKQPDGTQPARETQPAAGPITIKTADDYAKVPSGQQYIAPDGKLRTKP